MTRRANVHRRSVAELVGLVGVVGCIGLASGCSSTATPATSAASGSSSTAPSSTGSTPSSTTATAPSTPPTTRAPGTSTSTTATGNGGAGSSTTSAPTVAAEGCDRGTFRITKAVAANGLPALAVTELVASGGSTTLTLSDEGWELSDDGSVPMTLQATVAGFVVSGTLTISGTATGEYLNADATYRFTQDSATGSARAAAGTLSQAIPMRDIGPAIAPFGAATITCTATGLDLTSESGTLTLART